MAKAETKICAPNITYSLSNRLLIEYLLESGMNFSEKIANNPYFQLHLFNIFDILRGNDITNITYKKGVCYVRTVFGEYQITDNSDMGLTMVCNEKYDDGANIFTRGKTIYNIFPDGDDMLIIINKELAIGSITDYNCPLDKEMIVEHVSKEGFVYQKEELHEASMTNVLIVSFKSSLIPMTKEENLRLFKVRANHSDVTYTRITRDYNDVGKALIERSLPNHKGFNASIRYFYDDNATQLLSLDKFVGSRKRVNSGNIKKLIRLDTIDDSVISDICNEILEQFHLEGIYNFRESIDEIDTQKRLIRVLLSPEKNLMYN